MSISLNANNDGSGSVQTANVDAIQISAAQAVTIPQSLTVTGTLTASGGISGTGSPQIQPITASVAANALTVTLNPTFLSFRSATLGSGAVSTRTVASAISVTVPSTATLATINAVQSDIVVLAIDNAGTVELAVTNYVGGNNLDETTLITTVPIAQTSTFTGAIAVTTGILTLSATGTGTFAIGQALSGTGVPSGTFVRALLTGTLGAAGSTYSTNITTAVSSTTMTGFAGAAIYSTTARTSVPFRVVGIIESTQATAGTWATAPSTIQGAGGNALTSMQSLGYSQTWQDVTASRALATTYYNTTGRPILVIMAGRVGGGVVGTTSILVNGAVVTYTELSNSVNFTIIAPCVIPPGASYSASVTGAGAILSYWRELR
jgi:hypothetical protein